MTILQPGLLAAALLLFGTWRACCAVELEGNMTNAILVVENGTVDEVVLDCPYSLDEEDKSSLVIKWYHEDYISPIYQWIPNVQDPQLNALLKEVIDTSHEHSSDPHHRYRALRLVAPSTAVSGLYTCVVSTNFDEKRLDVNLIVYSLPSALSLLVEQQENGTTSAVCISEPAYPEPELELSLLTPQGSIGLETIRETTWSLGLFNTTLETTVEEEALEDARVAEFVCTLSIPHTNLSVSETLKFRPDGEPLQDYDDDEIVGSVVPALEEPARTDAVRHRAADSAAGVVRGATAAVLLLVAAAAHTTSTSAWL